MGVESYLTRTKLKLREDREISSAEAGELLVSTIVSVLEQAELSDGTKRARVAKYGSAEPLGWELVTELETELATEQGKVEHIWKPRHGTTIGQLKIKLGVTLMNTNRNAKPADFAKPWSTDSKGRPTKEINLMGFRKQLRNIIEWANVKDIDGLFSEVDKDGGGTLDAAELTSFMKKLHDIAVNANSIENTIQENIDALRQRIDFAQEVVNTTLEAERTESRLAVMANNSMVSARLGNAILRKATKIPDLVTSWDQTDGLVDKKQFRKNVRGYGVEGNDASMDELFNTIDKENGDGSGLVSAETLRTTLGSFREDAVEVDRETQRLKKVAEQTWKQVKSSQIELRKRRKAEEADAKAKEELAAAQAAERFKAAEEAQAAKDAKEQAKKEKEEEERAEYEAKIMARRRNSMTAVGAKLPSSPVGY